MTISSLNFDVTALREKILDLAMRGKLVPQNPDDEPASVLLEKIKAEKAQLVKEGKIKKSKKLPEITEDEKPFAIPDSWCWVRLGEVLLETIGGGTPTKSKPEYWNGNIPWISVKDVHEGSDIISKTQDTITQAGLENSSTNLIPKNTLIAVMRMAVGRIAVNEMDACINQDLRALITSNFFVDNYLKYIYPTLNFSTSGITVKGIKINSLLNTVFPLPPLEEQRRIADKIAQLFALLRKVESSTNDYAELQKMLHDKVLDLAMRGKLVEQDPNDEPASVLLEKIKAEKAQLVKEGKIKKSKPLPPITEDEKPFDIPDSWEWVRLGEIIESNIGVTYKPAQKSVSGIPILRANNIRNNKLNKDDIVYITVEKPLAQKYFLKKDDILMAVRSGSARLVGKSAVITSDYEDYSFGAFMSKIRMISSNSRFINYFFNSYLFRRQLGDSNTTTINQITQGMINNFVIPFPPLEEQRRMVDKISNILKV